MKLQSCNTVVAPYLLVLASIEAMKNPSDRQTDRLLYHAALVLSRLIQLIFLCLINHQTLFIHHWCLPLTPFSFYTKFLCSPQNTHVFLSLPLSSSFFSFHLVCFLGFFLLCIILMILPFFSSRYPYLFFFSFFCVFCLPFAIPYKIHTFFLLFTIYTFGRVK